MRRAVENCCNTHSCGNPDVLNFVPTRLLDLGETPEDTPVLILTAGSTTKVAKYAALSYYWGPQADANSQLKTEVSTLQDRLEGISMRIMSPVVRDAVEVCRLLSIRYLWVD